MLSSGEIIAVKQIDTEQIDPNKTKSVYESVHKEVKLLRELEHINIVKFWATNMKSNYINIFMELVPGGTIETLVKQYGPFEEVLFKNFTHQICNGINYMHSKNVVHR
jgi:mitogen-activated protein kinase kinase kinase